MAELITRKPFLLKSPPPKYQKGKSYDFNRSKTTFSPKAKAERRGSVQGGCCGHKEDAPKKLEKKNNHNFDWRSYLKPYYLEEKYLQDVKDGKDIKIPDSLWEDFDPLPCKELQDKVNLYILPINLTQNFSKFMKFDVDEKNDQMAKLQKQYFASDRTVEEKILIMNTIQQMQHNDKDFGFDQSCACSWKNIFDWIYKQDGEKFRKRFIEQFHKVQDLIEPHQIKKKKVKKRHHHKKRQGIKVENINEMANILLQIQQDHEKKVQFNPTEEDAVSSCDDHSSHSSHSHDLSKSSCSQEEMPQLKLNLDEKAKSKPTSRKSSLKKSSQARASQNVTATLSGKSQISNQSNLSLDKIIRKNAKKIVLRRFTTHKQLEYLAEQKKKEEELSAQRQREMDVQDFKKEPEIEESNFEEWEKKQKEKEQQKKRLMSSIGMFMKKQVSTRSLLIKPLQLQSKEKNKNMCNSIQLSHRQLRSKLNVSGMEVAGTNTKQTIKQTIFNQDLQTGEMLVEASVSSSVSEAAKKSPLTGVPIKKINLNKLSGISNTIIQQCQSSNQEDKPSLSSCSLSSDLKGIQEKEDDDSPDISNKKINVDFTFKIKPQIESESSCSKTPEEIKKLSTVKTSSCHSHSSHSSQTDTSHTFSTINVKNSILPSSTLKNRNLNKQVSRTLQLSRTLTGYDRSPSKMTPINKNILGEIIQKIENHNFQTTKKPKIKTLKNSQRETKVLKSGHGSDNPSRLISRESYPILLNSGRIRRSVANQPPNPLLSQRDETSRNNIELTSRSRLLTGRMARIISKSIDLQSIDTGNTNESSTKPAQKQKPVSSRCEIQQKIYKKVRTIRTAKNRQDAPKTQYSVNSQSQAKFTKLEPTQKYRQFLKNEQYKSMEFQSHADLKRALLNSDSAKDSKLILEVQQKRIGQNRRIIQ